jgi:transglutaminase-like putative cysteine protease
VGSIAFFTPSVSWREIRDAWREIERQRAAQQSETTRPRDTSEESELQPPRPTVKPALPREHLLTAGYAQSETIVMMIKTGELPPVVIQNLTTNAPRYYWRSTIYDQYVGAGWYSTSAPAQPIEPSQPLIPGVLSGYKLLHLNVQMQQPEGRLYWSGMLYSADIPLTVDWRLRPEPNLFADQSALLQSDMFAARSNASTYKADTYVPIPSAEQLRGASGEYPQHIQDLYFSLPGTVPERVHRLAQDITRGKETAYDKAKAIESYLRTNYPYDLEIDAPPEDRDVVDYFLFDLRRGYCDYYATAMVVLARSSGLPARFVSGYAPGEYDAPNAQYVIREKHAHSWAEIYFPEIGWVEFEPTGYQPEIIREEAVPTPIEEGESENATRKFLFELTSQRFSVFLFPIAVVVAMIILYFAVIERMVFLRLAPPVAIQILYRRLYRAGRPLAGERTRAETAYEFMNKLIQGIHTVHEELKFRHAPHKVKKDVEQLTLLYQSSLFSNHHVDEHDVKMALKAWSHLRWSLFIERIKYFISRRTKTYRDRVNQ